MEDIFTLGFYTGLRLGEIVNMRHKWINPKEGYITVLNDQQFANKGKKDRIIPLIPIVKNILNKKSYMINNTDSENYVFSRIPGVRI